MKQKVSPVIVVFALLLVVGVIGAVMYFSSEPPMVDIRKKSPEEWRAQMEATRKGMMGMSQAGKATNDNKTPDGKKTDAKAPATDEKKSETKPASPTSGQ